MPRPRVSTTPRGGASGKPPRGSPRGPAARARPGATRSATPLDELLRIATETGRLAVWEFSQERGLTPNPDLNRLIGFPPDASPGVAEIEAKMPGELDRLRAAVFAAMELGGRLFELEIGCARTPDDARWLLIRGELVGDGGGEPDRAIGVIIDITERKRAEERMRLLAREVDHRANNLLTVIEGIVSLAQEPDAASLKEAIMGRIEALAIAHRLMAASRWQGADLRQLIRDEVGAYSLADPSRVSIEGRQAALKPEQAQSLAMVFHELATNAAKYGALSVPEGKVSVSWNATDGGGLRLCWRETGGPLVKPPARRGFGTTLITRALADTLGARTQIDWRPEGLACEIELPGAPQAAPR